MLSHLEATAERQGVGVIVWAGSGVRTINWSELGAFFLNK